MSDKKKRTTLIQKFQRKSDHTRANIFVFISVILMMGFLGILALLIWLPKIIMISMPIVTLLLCVATVVYVAGYNGLAKKMGMQEIYWARRTIRIFSVMMLWIGLGIAWLVYTNY